MDINDLATKQTFEINDMAGIMCKLMTLLTGDVTKVVLAFALVCIGFGYYLGKINETDHFNKVSKETISQIKRGNNWSHVEVER